MKIQRNPLFCSLFLSTLLFSSFMAATLAQEVENEREFNYIEGSPRGPQNWGNINPEWAQCRTGKMQSPIDLTSPRVQIIPKTEEIKFFYNPGNATIKNRGHDIAVYWTGDHSKIQINGTDYILRQCHWHTPSEHTINRKRFDMELHLVHQSPNPMVTNKFAVIGLLYKIGSTPDSFLAKLMGLIQSISDRSEEVNAGVINPADIKIGGNKYYRYMGSLTTPPCSEGVIWTVNLEMGSVTREQIETLREAVDDDAMKNARPLQPRNSRQVNLYIIPRRAAKNC